MADEVTTARKSCQQPALQRHFGLLHATALNVTMIVGAGVFITIPLMLKVLPGPYALLGWLVEERSILVDGLIWSELAPPCLVRAVPTSICSNVTGASAGAG